MANAIHLALDLRQVDCHAEAFMKNLGITYDHATPQSIGDRWWFWNCRHVPSPMPPALSVLKCTPQEAIGYGLSKEDADRIDQGAATADLLTDLQAAHNALVLAADHLWYHEGCSQAYRSAANARDAACNALFKHRRATNAN